VVADPVTVIAGVPIPSTSPLFLAVVAVHVAFGLTCVVTGAMAMLSPKRRGRHSAFGTAYFWALAAVAMSAGALAAMRWTQDAVLFLLGALAFASALLGRTAARRRWNGWPRLHILGMGSSYVLMLTAFYVDNGKSLPIWKDLPELAYWLTPVVAGVPLIAFALLRHPVAVGRGARRGG
jgi:uncharacterized membrane protein